MDPIRVRMKTLCAGPSGVLREGQEYALPAEEARALIAGNYAVASPRAAETASVAAPEAAVNPPAAPKAETRTKPPKPAGKLPAAPKA